MIHIDSDKCTGCGGCIDACSQQAITIQNGLAVINQMLCIQCGACAEICPAGAIREIVPTHAQIAKGDKQMVYGFGRGFNRGGGAGFGFRGSSPPWPYVGRGRGGLPRCSYPGAVVASAYSPVPPSYSPQVTKEQEIDWLRSQAEVIKAELNRVEARIRDLETGK